MAPADIKHVTGRTASDKVLRGKPFNIGKKLK